MKKILSMFIILILLVTPISAISNIEVTTEKTTASIDFTTDESTTAEIKYGTSALTESKTSNSNTEHSILIEDLTQDTTYNYQIVTETEESTPSTFKTKLSNLNFEVDLPKKYNKAIIDIRGKTPANSQVLMTVNNQESKFNSDTGNGEFRFSRVKLIPNNINNIYFKVTADEEKEFYYDIEVDTIDPELTLSEVPAIFKEEQSNLRINGKVTENVSIIYTLKNERLTTKEKISNFRVDQEGLSSVTLTWDNNEDVKYYKIYRNDRLFAIQRGNTVTDHYTGSNTQYEYKIIIVDNNCNENDESSLTYTTRESEAEEGTPLMPEEDCKKLYQFDPIITDNTFVIDIPVEEGRNFLTITATDNAGNKDIRKINFTKDSIAPEITDISPEDALGSGYYIDQGSLGTRTTIKGKTEPFATVQLSANNNVRETAIADEDGNFEFKRLNIETFFSASGSHLPQDPNNIDLNIVDIQDEKNIDITLVATDLSGNIGQEQRLSFIIVPCGGGETKFTIMPLTKYQSPSTLSPDRLEEGSEQISFILNLTYNGNAQDWEVDDLSLEKRCRTSNKNKRYNLSCDILPESSPLIKKANPDKSAWYFSYNLNEIENLRKTTGLSMEDFIKAMTNEVVFPFDALLTYSENGKTKPMKKCFEVSYNLDNSRIDPRKVLPDWLLEDSIKLTNSTIKTIDKILPKIDQALKVTAAATIAGFIAKAVTRGVRKATCKIEQSTSKDCKKINEMTDKEMRDKGCTKCELAWKQEEKMNTVFRWAADRLLCHSTPAKWTADASESEVKTAIQSVQRCNNKEKISTRGFVLDYKQGHPKNNQQYNSYYVFDGGQYVFDGGKEGEKYILKKVYPRGGLSGPPDTLTVVKSNKQVMIEENDIPSYFKDDFIDNKYLKKIDTKQISPKCEQMKKENPKVIISSGDEYSYRENLLKIKCFNENKYLKDRDFTSCFGQDNFIYKKKMPILTPQQHTSAFQCLCLSGIYNRLKALKNIMSGLNGCFSQIQKTGEADSGTCKEIFTQYMCESMYQVVSYFSEGCAPDDKILGGNRGGGNQLKMTVSSIFDSIGESAQELNDEYGNAALTNYLGGGTRGIMRKVCLGSITGDWGLSMDNILDGAYSSTFNTMVGAFPVNRKYLRFVPYKDTAQYEYRAAWNIVPGCEINGYTAELACINSKTAFEKGLSCQQVAGENHPNQGCDCFNLNEEKNEFFYSGDQLTQGQFEDKSHSKIVESPYRYDHLKVKLHIFDAKARESCLPEGNKDGVFYFPLRDESQKDIVACSFDQLTGKYLCTGTDFLWDAKGRAYFTTIDLPKVDTTYSPGDELWFRGNVFLESEDKPQCLYAELQSKTGGKLSAFKPVYKKIVKSTELEFKVADLTLSNGQVKFDAFDKYRGTASLQVLSQENERDVEFTIKFIDNEPDGFTFDGKDRFEIYDGVLKENSKKEITTQGNLKEIITHRGVRLKINDLRSAFETQASGNKRLGHTMVIVYAKGTKLESNKKDWNLRLELRHLSDKSDDCQDTTAEDGLRLSEFEWKKDIPIKVEPRKQIDDNKCKFDGEYENDKCLCGTTKCGTSEEGRYCVDNKCYKEIKEVKKAKIEKEQKKEPTSGKTRIITVRDVGIIYDSTSKYYWDFENKNYIPDEGSSDINKKIAERIKDSNPQTCKDFLKDLNSAITRSYEETISDPPTLRVEIKDNSKSVISGTDLTEFFNGNIDCKSSTKSKVQESKNKNKQEDRPVAYREPIQQIDKSNPQRSLQITVDPEHAWFNYGGNFFESTASYYWDFNENSINPNLNSEQGIVNQKLSEKIKSSTSCENFKENILKSIKQVHKELTTNDKVLPLKITIEGKKSVIHPSSITKIDDYFQNFNCNTKINLPKTLPTTGNRPSAQV